MQSWRSTWKLEAVASTKLCGGESAPAAAEAWNWKEQSFPATEVELSASAASTASAARRAHVGIATRSPRSAQVLCLATSRLRGGAENPIPTVLACLLSCHCRSRLLNVNGTKKQATEEQELQL